MLGKKQFTKNEDWVATWERINKRDYDPRLIERLHDKTASQLMKDTRRRSAVFCWAGGKDSQALRHVCAAVGIKQGLTVVTGLEFPEYERWVKRFRPAGIHVEHNGLTLNWLASNPQFLFPSSRGPGVGPKLYSNGYLAPLHKAQKRAAALLGADMILLGRRTLDGNSVKDGKPYRNKSGEIIGNPIAAWTNEETLAYAHHYKLPLAPAYGWPMGWIDGPVEWSTISCTSEREGWERVKQIDDALLRRVAPRFASGREFLK